jgi:hypothetical protein
VSGGKAARDRRAQARSACGLFHAEAIANAEAEEEEENGAEDGLNGGEHFEASERSINCQTEIPAEAEDIQRICGAEAQGFPIGARIEIPEGPRPDSHNYNECENGRR